MVRLVYFRRWLILCCLLVAPAQALAAISAQNNLALMSVIMMLLDDTSGTGGAVVGSGELQAYWKLNDGSGQNAADASSYQRDAQVLCDRVVPCLPAWVAGQSAGALSFNGSTDYVSLPYQSLHGQGDVTISLWFKTAVSDHRQTLLSGAEQFNTDVSKILLYSGNQIRYYASDRSWDYEAWTITPFSDDEWHQLTIVRDDGRNEVTLYLDGVSYGSKFPSMDLIDIEPQALIVGLEQDRVGGRFDLNESFSGEIDEIKIISRALPRHEVELGYENRNWHHFSVQIDRSSDDAEGSSNPNLGDWDLDLHQYEVGLRFNQVAIPVGATIEKAYVEYRSNSNTGPPITVAIKGELSPNALTFDNGHNISSRPRTSAGANWDPLPWYWYQAFRTADLSNILQEIIDQGGWSSGNSLALLFEKGADSNRRGAITYDYRPEHAARLVVYFSGGDVDSTPPSVPANLQSFPQSAAISLSWDDASDAEGAISHYTLYRQKNGQAKQAIASIDKSNLMPHYTDSNVEAGANYLYTVTASNHEGLESAASNSVSALVQTADNSIALWRLDESSGITAADSGPNHLDGQLANAPQWVAAGVNGGALLFDGVENRLDLPGSALNGAKNLTVSMWIKTTKAGEQSLISGANVHHDNAFLLELGRSDYVGFYANNEGVGWDIEPINDDQWHHILLIVNNATNGVSLYIDGIFQGGERLTLDAFNVAEGGLVVGQEQDSIGGGFDVNQAFAGSIDEIRIEQRIIDWVEIQNQVQMDSSPPGVPLALSATAGEGALVNLSWLAASDAETGICKYRIYRGTTSSNIRFAFEVANVTQVTDTGTANDRHYIYQVSAENCVAMEGGLSAQASVDTGSDASLGFQTVSNAQWDETAVRRVLNIFAYGGHASDAQIAQWAALSPETAIVQILSFSKTNPLLSPAEDASAQYGGSLLALQNFWGGQAADNPMRADKRKEYFPLYFNSNGDSSVSYSALERTWTQAVATRGLNPFLHKMAFFLSNYQMSISEFKTRPALIRDYYDTLLDALSTKSNFVDVIKTGAKHATVAKAYGHENSTFYNDTLEFEGNDDFAREFFQLFFAIQGETEDPEYHEGVTIKNNARLLTGMQLDREVNAYGSDSSGDWDTAPLKFTDHIDSAGEYIYNQSNHHANCLEILHTVVCGATAADKIDVLAPMAANHAESLANLPLYIINLFADDNFTPEKERAIQSQWRQANFNLLNFLRSYAISTTFHSADTYKFLSSYDRSLMLFNLITNDNKETFLGLNRDEDAEVWLDYQGLNPFNPTHDVFGDQTGLEAATNPFIFKQVYEFEVDRNTLQKTKQLYYLDDTEIDATTWYKDWGSKIPDDGNGNYVVADVAAWLWNHLIGDGGKNFDLIAKSQLYALLARGDDFAYLAVEEGLIADIDFAYSSDALVNDPGASALLATLAAEHVDLGSTDIKDTRRLANERVGQAVQFIAMLPYTFAVEGQ